MSGGINDLWNYPDNEKGRAMTDPSNPTRFERTKGVVLTSWHYLSYLLPILLLIWGYYYSSMRANVFDPITDQLGWDLLKISLVAFLWIGIDFFAISNHRTPAYRLQENNFFSYLTAIGLSGLALWSLGRGQLAWFMIIPATASVIDGYITSNRAIENALGKPNVQFERETR
jgi:hypothetical protein